MGNYNVPIAFIFFKRLETTKQVFEAIKRQQPRELYLIADGARNEAEAKMVDTVRGYVEDSIDWECDVHRNFAPANMGCKERIISGLNWVFEQTDRAIIIEDDVKPNDSFFTFTEELLDRYVDDDRVMMIGGFNFNGTMPMDESYWFYNRTSIWGWATWRRAWQKLDYEMKEWPKLKKSGYLQKNFSKKVATMLIRDTDRAYYKEVDTWDYTWEYSMILNHGLCILPNRNLIENIGGNDVNATHTSGDVINYEISELGFPLNHPRQVVLDKKHTEEIESREADINYFKEYLKAYLPRNITKAFREVK